MILVEPIPICQHSVNQVETFSIFPFTQWRHFPSVHQTRGHIFLSFHQTNGDISHHSMNPGGVISYLFLITVETFPTLHKLSGVISYFFVNSVEIFTTLCEPRGDIFHISKNHVETFPTFLLTHWGHFPSL